MSRNPGYLVETSKGTKGRTYHSKGLINGKLPVYPETAPNKWSGPAILCDPDTVTLKGFID